MGLDLDEPLDYHGVQVAKGNTRAEHMPEVATYPGEPTKSYGGDFTTINGFNAELVRRRFEATADRLVNEMPGRVLELGPADGGMSPMIRTVAGKGLMVWDGTAKELLKTKVYPFDVVYCMHVLEHVTGPVTFLREVRRLVKDGGIVFLSVPNAYSLHRILGVELGVIATAKTLGPRDHAAGHRAVYDIVDLEKVTTQAGFATVERLPVLAKPFPDRMMEDCTGRMLDNLAVLAQANNVFDSQLLLMLECA